MSDSEQLTQLGKDYRELRAVVSNLPSLITAVDGKVEKAISLLERQSERQDRADLRIDRIELERDQDRIHYGEEIRRLEQLRENDRDAYRLDLKEIEDKGSRHAKLIYIGMGAVMLATFSIPILVKVFG